MDEVRAATIAFEAESLHVTKTATRAERLRSPWWWFTFKRVEPMQYARPREAAEIARAEAARDRAIAAASKQRLHSAREHAVQAAKERELFDLDEPDRATVRTILPDDKWIETFDDHTGRFAYYNVTSGARQWRRPPVQPWHIAEGRFVPYAAPTVFSDDNAGELAAHRAEEARLAMAAVRASAEMRVQTSRKAGDVPRALAGVDLGPASAKVIPGSVRVGQHGEGGETARVWRTQALEEAHRAATRRK
jgi:hypothetical protein